MSINCYQAKIPLSNAVLLIYAASLSFSFPYLVRLCLTRHLCSHLGPVSIFAYSKCSSFFLLLTLTRIYLVDEQSTSISFLVLLLLSLVMGIVLNYTMFLCTIVNSALTTTIVGVLKGVGSTVCDKRHLFSFSCYNSLKLFC